MRLGRCPRSFRTTWRRWCAPAVLLVCTLGSAYASPSSTLPRHADESRIFELPPPKQVESSATVALPLVLAKSSRGEQLPPRHPEMLPEPRPNPKAVPISLDTVLRLARDQNGQVQLDRKST